MQINPQIFREYDIRGVVGKDLTLEVVRTLGQGFGTYMIQLGHEELVVGRDGRLSSKAFEEALIEGLDVEGVEQVWSKLNKSNISGPKQAKQEQIPNKLFYVNPSYFLQKRRSKRKSKRRLTGTPISFHVENSATRKLRDILKNMRRHT
jgi:hypothetical protein